MTYNCFGAKLKVEIAGYPGSDCLPGRNDVHLSGSQCWLILEITDLPETFDYRGLPIDPMENLELLTGTKPLPADAPMRTTESLGSSELELNSIEHLNPQFFVTKNQRREHAVYQTTGAIDDYYANPRYYFLIQIPSNLSSTMLCVRARLNDPEFGTLEGEDCALIVAPCSEEDNHHTLGTFVCLAYERADFEHAVELTDSLLATGWRWWNALIKSQTAAQKIGRYDRALTYLDILYNTYGRVQPVGVLNPEYEAKEYERMRTKLVELCEQQQR